MSRTYKIIALSKGGNTLVSEEDFHWLNQRQWHVTVRGYVACNLFGRRTGQEVLMHRLVLLAHDTSEVDHIDRDPLNNCRWNLRIATRSEQMQNTRSYNRATSFRGVQRNGCDTLTVCAMIRGQGKRHYLGCFSKSDDAAMAYDIAARHLFGPHARTNFPGVEPPAYLTERTLERLRRSMTKTEPKEE